MRRRDFITLLGAVVVDAALFVPQSRPRLFMIGVRGDVEIPPELAQSAASPLWHRRGLRTALDNEDALHTPEMQRVRGWGDMFPLVRNFHERIYRRIYECTAADEQA